MDRLRLNFPVLDMRRANRKLKVLILVCSAFFILWLCLKVFAQADFWPLLAAPILLSAWFFYEAGVIATVAITGLLLVQTSFDKPDSVLVAIGTFAIIGLAMGWALRRQRQANSLIIRNSLTDSLTGLYNYGYFMEALDREIHRSDRYGGSLTLVILDIDHFKMFNDRFGHQMGNRALNTLAAALKREKRESDIVARYGGEEFVLLIPGEEAAGIETARRLRRAISQLEIRVGGNATTSITVSAGVASYPGGASSREELIENADRQLYTSKRNGRNRVTVAPVGRQLAV
jgi:diguanylate cyclase (GGDEF)-like protein